MQTKEEATHGLALKATHACKTGYDYLSNITLNFTQSFLC